MTSLRRLRRASPNELAWRLRALARVHRDRLIARFRAPRWRRRALESALSPRVASASLRRDLSRGDWMGVHHGLVRELRGRPSRFVLDHHARTELQAAVLNRWPDADRDARARADRLLAGEHDLLGYRSLTFRGPTGAVDWHRDPVHGRRAPFHFWADVPYLDPKCGDHKIIWELNRHQHWLALGRACWLTGEPRYRRAIVDELSSWLDANPPLVGVNWASMLEIGFRSLSWIWALHILLGAEEPPDEKTPWLVDLLVALDCQLAHVERNLSYYFSPNTHLTGEALALYVAGRTLPELGAGTRWENLGRSVLLAELDTQVARDGGHLERSTHYHRYTLDFYLLALLVAERTGDSAAAAPFREAVGRLAAFMRAMADDRGRIPLIGDDDGGMLWPLRSRDAADVRASLSLAAVVLGRADLAPWDPPEETCWLVGNRPIPDVTRASAAPIAPQSAVFPDTGYAVIRQPHGGHLIFDVGRHGYLNAGHAHADALAVTLSLEGRPLLVDPGTCTYTMNAAVRDRLRSSLSHNTVTVDGRSPSEPLGPFEWRTRADAQLGAWRANPRFAWAEGSHDGYGAIRHRRSVFGSGIGWLIVDEVLGSGQHRADACWHFDPAWLLRRDTADRLRALHMDGATVWVMHEGADVSLAHGDDESGMGWRSPSYGTLQPCWSARVTRAAAAPFSLVTAILSSVGTDPPRMERGPVDSDPHGETVAVRLAHGGLESVIVLRPGDPAARDTRTCVAGDYQTNGRLLRYSTRAGRFVALDIADASHALALRDGWLSVAADEHMADLHVSLEDDCLDIRSSAPLPRLRLQGGVIGQLRSVRVNGRRWLPPVHAGGPETLIISSAGWHIPPGEPAGVVQATA